MERIARGVNANKSHAFVDGVEKFLLALLGHGWLAVRSHGGEVAGGEKNDSGIFMELRVVENPSVLGDANVESVLVAESGHRVVHDAGLAVNALDDVVLEAGGFGKYEHGFLRRGRQTFCEGKSGAGYGGCAKKFSASCHGIHRCAPQFALSGVLRDARSRETPRRHSLLSIQVRACPPPKNNTRR